MNKPKLAAAIAYFEDAIRESDEIIAECSPGLQAELTEQKAHFVVALEAMRAPLPDNKALTVEELRERKKPVWCDIPDCEWIPEGGFYCLCENGVITPPSKQTFSAEECLKNGWKLLDRPPEKGE